MITTRKPRFGDHVEYKSGEMGAGIYVGLIVDVAQDGEDVIVGRRASGRYTETPFKASTLSASKQRE